MSKLMYRKAFADTYDFKLEDGHCVANCAFDKGWFTVSWLRRKSKIFKTNF